MNFTNSPYERMMEKLPRKEAPAPQKASEGTPCAGCPYWQGIGCVFCYRERLRSRGDVLIFGLKKRPICKGLRFRSMKG